MRTVSISELKNRLSEFLKYVRAGESVLVLDRGAPVAVIERVGRRGRDDEGRALRLERAGLMRRPRGRPLDVAALKRPGPKARASVLAALIEERDSGR